MKQDNDIDREEVPVGEPLADAPDEAAASEVGNLKRQAVNSVLWRIFETGGRQVIFFIISVVLARLILPESYGTVAMLTIFTTVANAFIDSGFSTALIRKTDRTQTDCSTVFWFNILVALLCYATLFLSAPLIARFYYMPVLTPVLRVSAISLVIGSIAGVQRALLTAELRFKLLAKLNIAGLLLSGAAGILLAYLDFQVWALVWNGIIGTTVSTILIWIYGKWRPTLEFSRQSFKEFFSFGSKLLASGLLDTVYNNISGIIIGKVYRARDLAFYNRAQSLGDLTSAMPTGVLQSVTFPTLCKIQHDDRLLADGYRRMIRLSCFIIFPLTLGLGAVAYPLINVLLTSRWLPAAALLQILAFSKMTYPFHAINLNLLEVKGRSDLFFRLEVIKKIMGVSMLFITVPYGVEAMIWGGLVTSVICMVLNSYYTGKLINYGFIKQLKDIFWIFLLASAMYAAVKMLTIWIGNGIWSLLAGIATGVIIYGAGAYLFRMPELAELRRLRK